MDLTNFLLARIAEDEEMARAAEPGRWTVEPVIYGPPGEGWGDPPPADVLARDGSVAVVSHVLHEGGGAALPDAQHIARWNPTRVLAECEAKRRIVPRHERCGTGMGPCDEYSPGQACEAAHLAAVYADHPDYRDEWRP